MEPYASTSAESTPAGSAKIGMIVVDSAGEKAGTVMAVQLPGTEVRPDVPAGIAERLMATGYFLVDGSGELSNDTYAAGDQVEDVTGGEPGTVTLRVPRSELFRTES